MTSETSILQHEHALYTSRKTEFCCVWLYTLRVINELVLLCNPLMEDETLYISSVLLLFVLTLKEY